jgi:hypothetical protein
MMTDSPLRNIIARGAGMSAIVTACRNDPIRRAKQSVERRPLDLAAVIVPRGGVRPSDIILAKPAVVNGDARLTAATCCLARQPFQQSRHLHRVPMTAAARRWNVAFVECLSNGVQACYPARPQLRNDTPFDLRALCGLYRRCSERGGPCGDQLA